MQKIDLTKTKNIDDTYKKINYDAIKKKYNDIGTKYCFDVLNGKIIAGYQIKLACFRHLQDLKRVEEHDSAFPYHYDLKQCRNILKFAAICPNIDSPNENTKLLPWEVFIMTQLFGWRDVDDNKRFTQAMVSVARANGKTYFASIVICYSFLIESIGQSNQDYLITAPTYKQAGKLFGYVKTMLKQITSFEPFHTLAKETDLYLKQDEVIEKATNNVLRLISYESNQYDSYHFRTAVFDEIGDITSDENISKITSGQIKVNNHQFIQISTAYEDPTAPFHKEEEMMVELMEQDYKRDGDTTLCLNWCQDNLNEVFDENKGVWEKSNPLLALKSQHAELLKGLIDERNSMALKGKLNDFQIKNMNMWLQAKVNSFLELKDIEDTVIDDFEIDNRDCYIGFDYSLFSDNTAIAFVFPYNNQWFVMQHSFIPFYKAGSMAAKEKQDGINYTNAANHGFCTITNHPQGMINNDQVYQWLLDFVTEHNLNVLFFGYDAFGVNSIIKNLEMNTTWNLEAIRQRTSELKDPTKFLQRGFVEKKITHLNDPILEKALVNAEITEDKIGIQVDKAKATLKIDVVDAIIDAMYQGMYHFEDFSIVNDKSKQVDRMSEEDVLKWFESDESGLT